jgi:hypothetical protein
MNTSSRINRKIIESQRTRPKNAPVDLPQKFTQTDVDLAQTPLFFPEGFEKIFLLVYFVTLPYIAGLFFLFFYVAEGKIESFISLNDNSSFLLTWTIGYEIIAVLIILYIIKMFITFAN